MSLSPARTLPLASLLLTLFAVPARGLAHWELHRIHQGPGAGHVLLKGDFLAFESSGDIYLYRISSGQLIPITDDGNHPPDVLLAVDQFNVWFWSCSSSSPYYSLYSYAPRLNRKTRRLATDDPVSLTEASASLGCLVYQRDHDWWFWDGNHAEKVTYSGEDLVKSDPFLVSGLLFWTASGQEPGVYLTDVFMHRTTYLSPQDTSPLSFRASGVHTAWLQPTEDPEQGYDILHYRLHSGDPETIAWTDLGGSDQLGLTFPWLVWVRSADGPFQVMGANLEDHTVTCLHETNIPILNLEVSEDQVALLTSNCPGPSEECSELNVLDLRTGLYSQVTYFGASSSILSYALDAGRIAFRRSRNTSPHTSQVFLAVKTASAQCGTLVGEPGSSLLGDVAVLAAPLVVLAWLRQRAAK